MKNIKVNVEGMHCPSCAMALKIALEDEPGVEKAEVSLNDKEAKIEYEADKIDLEKFKQIAKDLDFTINE